MEDKNLITIVSTVVITALIVGGVVYSTQNSKSKDLQKDIDDLKTQVQTDQSQAQNNQEMQNTISDLQNQIADLQNQLAGNNGGNDNDRKNNDTQNNIDEFSIVMDGNTLAAGEWENQSSLLKTLGKPVSEKIETLGQGSDTYEGSFEKNTKYSDIEVISFSPKDNGKTFWVMEAKTTSSKYATKQGIKVGDNISILKKSYPNISIALDGRTDTDNCAYELKDSEPSLKKLLFEVKNGKIIEIKIEKGLW